MSRSVWQAIAMVQPKAPASEAYRTLRTNLYYASPDRPIQTVLITSAGPGEGKSVTAANLAVVLAQSGKNTLLIDCDLRKPVQHRVFGLRNTNGLTKLLVQGGELDPIVHKTTVPRLNVLTSGPIPPNPAELLSSGRLQSFLQEAGAQYDSLVIDGPPLIAVTDSAILASKVDGVLIVVRSGEARIDMVQEAKSILEGANARILGIVLNAIKRKTKDYHYYYYYGHRSDKSGTSD